MAPIIIYPKFSPKEPDEDLFEISDSPSDANAPDKRLPAELKVICHTPKIYVAQDGTDIVLEEKAKEAVPLTADEFEDFMAMVKVTGKEGSHSIANEWAAHTIGHLLTQDNNNSVPKNTKDLEYLCYLLLSSMSTEKRKELCGSNNKHGQSDKNKIKSLNVSNKKVLLIDDQDDVWTSVVEKLVGNKKVLTVWGNNTNNDKFKEILSNINDKSASRECYNRIIEEYDLVLLDMRLLGETKSAPGNELSGLIVLKKLMELNKGLRVIMFTSSNKVWNIQRALELGAASIFIKESPQYLATEEERTNSLNKLITDIEDALNHAWLKDVYSMARGIITNAEKKAKSAEEAKKAIEAIEAAPDTDDNYIGIDLKEKLYKAINTQVEVALQLFLIAGNDTKKIQLSYFSLYSVLELYKQYFQRYLEEYICYDSNGNELKYDKEKPDKMHKILFGIEKDDYFGKTLYSLRWMRNNFVHHTDHDTNHHKVNQYENIAWSLGSKQNQPIYELHSASDPNAFRALMYTLSKIVPLSLKY